MGTKLTTEEIERIQIEALIRDELDDKPVEYSYTSEYDGEKTGTFRFTYDGVPEWCASDFKDLHSDDCDYFTAVYCSIFGLPPETIAIDGKSYDRKAYFGHSGETECVCRSGDPDDETVTAEQSQDGCCPFCEGKTGEAHGMIYLGEGWSEVIYRHDRVDHMRALAESHNLVVWTDSAVEWSCEGTCNDDKVTTLEAVNANGGGCPDCGEPFTGGKIVPNRWWWWCCSPGCLPEGPPDGPHDTEREALESATEGLDD